MAINVTRSSMPSHAEYCDEIKSIFENVWLTNMGPKHNEFEEKLKTYLSVPQASLFNNGHLALYCAIQALHLSGEVITTPFTFASTTNAIVQNGLTPVFCDIKPDDYTMDPGKIEALITEKTTAIIPVHVYGNVCDFKSIERIAQNYNLKVIYDAAHTFGVRIGETGVGTLGDVSMFSFHATKVFHSIEGGALTFKTPELYESLKRLKNFGIAGEQVEDVGMNAKMNEFQAAMGLCNLRHVDVEIVKRKKAVQKYWECLDGVPGLKLWREQPGVVHNYAYFPVLFDAGVFGKSRDQVAAELSRENIFARKYFYPLTSAFQCYRGRFPIQPTPAAEFAAENVLTLPLYADLTPEDVERICSLILK